MESRVPVLVMEKAFVADSGGPGRMRGGLAQRIRFRKRDEDGMEMLVSVYPEGVDNPIKGLFGGLPGLGARGRIISATSEEIHDCGTGQLVSLFRTDEVVELILGGGSGFGDPSERDHVAVARDLKLGLITSDHAAHHYSQSAKPSTTQANTAPYA
jgi:5-oxoprolinase (ATP-hydrolysing)/N-methylhydantoinase A